MKRFVLSEPIMTEERRRVVIEAYKAGGHSESHARKLINNAIAKMTNGDSYLYNNGDYVVIVQIVDTGFGDMFHLSMRNEERTPMLWKEKQAIKNAILGEEFEAIELYPKESRLVDGANQYHLFCIPTQGDIFPFTIAGHM